MSWFASKKCPLFDLEYKTYGIRSRREEKEFDIFIGWICQSAERIFTNDIRRATNSAMEIFEMLIDKHRKSSFPLIEQRWSNYGLVAFESYNNIKNGLAADSKHKQENALRSLPKEIADHLMAANKEYDEFQAAYSPLLPFPSKELCSEFLNVVLEKEDPLSFLGLSFLVMGLVGEIKERALENGSYSPGSETEDHYIASTFTT